MSITEQAKQITALIPTVESGDVAVRVVSPDGTVGYLVGEEAFSHRSSDYLRTRMIARDKAPGLISEHDMLAGAITTSMMIFGEKALVGFCTVSVSAMAGESIIGKQPRFVVLREYEDDGSTELVAVLTKEELRESDDKYDDEEYAIVTLESIRYQYAWNTKTDEPYADDPNCNGKKMLLLL